MRVCSALAFVGVLLIPAPAHAGKPRPRFDPSDLELQDVGGVELDMQYGIVHSEGSAGNRLLLPDWELDIGIWPQVELDIDSAFSLDQFDSKASSWSSDALWIALSLLMYDWRNDTETRTFALGMQLGPKFPMIRQSGVGYAALGLVGLGFDGLQTTYNAGFVFDPVDNTSHHHPLSLVTGFDLHINLDRVDRWAIAGDASLAYFLSNDPSALTFTLGPSFKPDPHVELQLAGLADLLPGGDRYGVLAQITLTGSVAPDAATAAGGGPGK